MKKLLQNILMFTIGFCVYVAIEILYRGYSFRLMGISGGLLFCFGGLLNNRYSWKMDLLLQCGIISFMVTLLEAIVGNIDYYWLHLNMWDYSTVPFNYFNGKICLPFSLIWFLFGFMIVIVHDAITYYWLHDGEQPRYYIFGKHVWTMPQRKCID